MKSPAKLYEFHVANLRMIGSAIDHFARAGRDALAHERNSEVASFIRGFALLLGVEAEARLSKLLYEPSGFGDSERASVFARSTQAERWETAVELAFRKHYGIPKAPLTETVLLHSSFHRYLTLNRVLEDKLSPVIRARNKLAHGQWEYPLNDTGDDVVSDLYKALADETLLSLELKRHVLRHLISAIHDLVVSKPTFERDFDIHYRAFVDASLRTERADYTTWARILVDKARRGRDKRRQSTSP